MRDRPPGASDSFRPPDVPIQVFCLHCRRSYDSSLMHWVADRDYPSGGYWACPTEGCDGKGFTFDIWPADSQWAEQTAGVVFADDESEDDDASDPLLEDHERLSDTDAAAIGIAQEWSEDQFDQETAPLADDVPADPLADVEPANGNHPRLHERKDDDRPC
ncbi:hypothetical protein [Fontivita pretiosa]|uniref:hypothetical protein n=1 Tax=Fontivita pretiosa TaxID=2989684 RepID=UPI003D17B6D4